MSGRPAFRVDSYQNEYLPAGSRQVNAILTVTAEGTPSAQPAAGHAAVVIIVDCSTSMMYPREKIRAAKQATSVAIDTLREGTEFAVIAGTDHARLAFPTNGSMAIADAAGRAAAKRAVQALDANGGTAIGSWLTLANQVLATRSAIRHAILLTDGRNQHEQPDQLARAVAACQGNFVCDCRGVGTDWDVNELRGIASALLGSVDIVADPAGLETDFRAMTAAAMGKSLADVALRLWTPQGATVRFVKQVAPTVVDLTDRRVATGPQHGDYPTGSWGAESRDYHVCVEVNPGQSGDVMLAARASLVADDEVLAQGLVKAVWTDDEALSTRISAEVAHYTGQAELAQAIQEGMAARRDGDLDRATSRLGRALALANQTGNAETADLLAKVVEVDDPVTGTVRLKSKVSTADAMTLDTRSTKTSRVRKG
ncbi:MAG TPA: VWA domain-containing protein [Pseudonocardiaceae bacterium]